jgi:hypothetical protein
MRARIAHERASVTAPCDWVFEKPVSYVQDHSYLGVIIVPVLVQVQVPPE